MPTVSRLTTPTVQSQFVQGARAPVLDVSSGTQAVAAGIQQLGRGFAERQQRIDETEAESALVQFERDKNDLFYNPDTGYFNTQGRDAYDGADGITQSLGELQRQYESQLGSDNARLLFGRATSAQVTRSQVDVSRHASSGLQAWEVATTKARVENTLESAALLHNDPERLAVQRELGRQSVIDSMEMQGITGEARNEALQTYESSFAASTIEAAVSSSAAEGRAALTQYGDRLEGSQKVKIDKLIAARELKEKSQRDSNSAVNTATRLVNDFDSRSDAIEEVDKIKDPELRKLTLQEVNTRFNQRKTAEAEARVAAFEEAEDHIAQGGTAQQFQVSNPDEWERMSPGQRKVITSGKNVTTDWSTFTDVMALTDAELAKIDPDDYTTTLASSERSKLANAVIAARGDGGRKNKIDAQTGRGRIQQTTATIERLVGDKKRDWSKEEAIAADQFYALVDDELSERESVKGSKLTSQEYTAMLGDLTRKSVLDRSFLGVDIFRPDLSLSVGNVPAERVNSYAQLLRDNDALVTGANVDVLHRVADDLAEGSDPSTQLVGDLSAVIGRLQQLNIPVTPANVSAKYRQALGR